MATILDGRHIATRIKDELKSQVDGWRAGGHTPKLVSLLVGDAPDALVYVRTKERLCRELGIAFEGRQLPAGVTTEKVLEVIEELNAAPSVHGIIVELPLPATLDRAAVLEAVSPLKDVDGSHPLNRGYLMARTRGLYPATPLACITILERAGIEMAGRHAVIVGRGETVGKPLIHLLLQRDATVTVCHTKTQDLAAHTRQADLLFVAAGRARLITREMVKPGAVVVDAGINATPAGICGDVDFAGVSEVAGAITPVPGGVGSLTPVMLMVNLLQAMCLQELKMGDVQDGGVA
ncbi:MAG: bifunctional 5,10-methylenetetrahydrofolate dehydrogenase/5,10-methenyltetrahydrofolate cyclohydrolase [Desulfotomaculales bacterium]